LLEPSQTEPLRHSKHHWRHFAADNLRILSRHDWRDVVWRIAGFVPIIVMDTRLASPAVVEEARHVIQVPLRDKTLFVVADDGNAPALVSTGVSTSSPTIRTARLHDVVRNLKAMGLTKTASPDDIAVLAQASFARNSRKIAQIMSAIARTGMPFAAAV